jgi:hypothetical protein
MMGAVLAAGFLISLQPMKCRHKMAEAAITALLFTGSPQQAGHIS